MKSASAFRIPYERRRSILAFLLGVLALTHVRLVGYITLAEIGLLLLGVPYLLLQGRVPMNRVAGILLGFCALWLISALFSDLHSGSPVPMMLRGLSRTFLLFLNTLCFYVLFRQYPRAYRSFCLGVAISAVIILKVGRQGDVETMHLYSGNFPITWETAYVTIFTFAVLGGCSFLWERHPRWSALLLFLAGGFSLLMGTRSSGAILMAGASVAAYLEFSCRIRQGLLDGKRFLRMLLVISATALLVAGFYVVSARSGLMGEKARSKFEYQANLNGYFILGARPEFLGGMLAVKDSPVLGHGSWAVDEKMYFAQALELLGYDKATVEDVASNPSRIPAHSHILEAWVEHGLLATLFWFYVLWVLCRAFRYGFHGSGVLLPILCVQGLFLFWNIFFSPMGNRVLNGAFLALLLVSHEWINSRLARRGQPSQRLPRQRENAPRPSPSQPG